MSLDLIHKGNLEVSYYNVFLFLCLNTLMESLVVQCVYNFPVTKVFSTHFSSASLARVVRFHATQAQSSHPETKTKVYKSLMLAYRRVSAKERLQPAWSIIDLLEL